jgi:hypothetical protein
MTAPTPKNYAQWCHVRAMNTRKYMELHREISGADIKNKNLSMTILIKSGYVLDTTRDTMIKRGT